MFSELGFDFQLLGSKRYVRGRIEKAPIRIEIEVTSKKRFRQDMYFGFLLRFLFLRLCETLL